MSSWVVQSLLLCAVFGAVFCQSPEIQVVQNLIAASNKIFRERNETEIPLPDIGWMFEPINYRQGRLGQFDTLELLPDPEIVSRTNAYGTLYTFSVSTALRNLTVKYKFHVNYPFFGKEGNVTITVNKKSFQLEGRVMVKHDGTCYAVLQGAKVVQFGDFEVKYEPDDAPFITRIYQVVLNFVNEHMIPIINLSIRFQISQTAFRKQFNNYVCNEVTGNSTTEAPITGSPTTYQPEPSPTSRAPHHSTTDNPFTYSSTLNPFPDSSTPQPFTDSSTVNPFTDSSTVNPFTDSSTVQPSPTSRAPYHSTTDNPFTDSPTVQPFTESSTVNPFTDSSTVQPFTESSTVNPFTDSPTVQPFTESSTVNQLTDSSTAQPFTD